MATAEVKISELPEEVTAEGLKIYGTASYETQVAILSQQNTLFIDDYNAMDSELYNQGYDKETGDKTL